MGSERAHCRTTQHKHTDQREHKHTDATRAPRLAARLVLYDVVNRCIIGQWVPVYEPHVRTHRRGCNHCPRQGMRRLVVATRTLGAWGAAKLHFRRWWQRLGCA
jgi:hypothetical protein